MKKKTCLDCKVLVSDIGRHKRRMRCKAQHCRGGYFPSGVKGTGGLD